MPTTASTQYVWDQLGPADQDGGRGATGGGCSRNYQAKTWQSHATGYTAVGCGGKRLAADVSALADPNPGFDIRDTWGTGDHGWASIGGTSLASPMVAAMYALAGGSGDAAYPAQSIYQNTTQHPTDLFDVIHGGNSFCQGSEAVFGDNDTMQECASAVNNDTSGDTNNPNNLAFASSGDALGIIDCTAPRSSAQVPPSLTTYNPECNATANFDGPTGLGTPQNGIGLFAATNDAVTFQVPRPMRLSVAQTYTTHAKRRGSTVSTVASYVWHWGNGTSTTTTHSSIKHTYRKAGTYTIELVVTDTLGQTTVRTSSVTVGRLPVVRISGASSLKVGQTGAFGGRQSSDPNTGGAIAHYIWTWGDGSHRTLTPTATHRWSKSGTYTVTLTVVNNTGERNSTTRRVRVRA
jgi:hypothetical protein